MCLGVPGRVISIEDNPLGLHMGKGSFGGIVAGASQDVLTNRGPRLFLDKAKQL